MNATARTRIRLGSLGLALVLLVTACLRTAPPTREVLIPETTNVAGPDTRAALESFDPATGEMRFSTTTPLLEDLATGDVIVSEPSEAAPAGYLRKVKTVIRDGETVTLGTTQANLTDAITQGEFTQAGDFLPDDLSHATAHYAGVTAGIHEPDLTPEQIDIGDGYRFKVGFDEVALDVGNGDVQVKVVVNGELYFNAGWNVGIGIEPCFEVPPVCVDRFEAWMGVEEQLKVSISGEAKATLEKEIKVATYYFKPLIFFIGPVPIVIVPTIEVFVGASGTVSLTFSYGVTQSATAKIGAKWTDSGGWQDITGFGIEFDDHDGFELAATMNATAYARALASLKIYDVTGVGLEAKLGAEFDTQIPRDPTLIATGTIEGNVAFVVGLPIVGTLSEHEENVFRERFELFRSPNAPPVFTNVRTGTIDVDIDKPVPLATFFSVEDPEGSELTLVAQSSKDGQIPLIYTFPTLGSRTVTVTATDPHGASASIVLTIDVKSPPPIITTSYSGSPFVGVPYAISASAYDLLAGELFCSALSWAVQAPDVVQAGGGGCDGEVTFGAEGNRTVAVTATNPYGITSTETLVFDVGPEPENKPPVITYFSIVAAEGPKSYPTGPTDPYGCPTGYYCEVPPGASLWNGQVREVGDYVLPLTLRAEATDDQGAPITFTWTCTGGANSATVTSNGDGTYSCSPYFPGNTIVVRLTVGDGVTTTSWERSFYMRSLIN